MKKLSECIKEGIAYCQNCNEYFIDDVPIQGSVVCPNDKCQHLIIRGLTKVGNKVYYKGKEFKP